MASADVPQRCLWWHQWSRWEDVFEQTDHWLIQRRYCLRCNRVQTAKNR